MADTERIEDVERELAGSAEARTSLLVYHRDGAEIIPLEPGAPIVIGRTAPAHAYEDASLSGEHAAFELTPDGVSVTDLASTNGTYVNGARVDRAVLRAGDEVAIGALVVTLHARSGGRALGLDGHDRFAAQVAGEVRRAQFFRRPVSVVFVRAFDREPVRRFAHRVRGRLRVVDQAGLYSDGLLELLLPEADAAQALELARALATDREVPRLACGVASFPEAARSADELLAQALAAVQRTTATAAISLASAEAPGVRALAAPGAPVATSPAMRQLLESAARLAKGSVPVLVLGETGAGKEVLARYLHEVGPRREEPFVAVNCGAIPPSLIESTLFGHEKGAFTGANAQHQGVFESAGAGMVFLDEIGELPAPAQAALLRVLETRRITRVGSTREVEAPARIVAATHRDLDAMAATGAFRSDLLYRLNALTLHIPALRDRRDDIAELVARFMTAANAANEAAVRGIDPDALDALRAYAWPGNVRELRNAIDRAVVIARGDTITIEDLPAKVRACEAPPPAAARPAGALGDDFRTRLDRAERDILVAALREADWNQSECARQLRMPLRTLVYKIKAHGLRKLGYGAPDS